MGLGGDTGGGDEQGGVPLTIEHVCPDGSREIIPMSFG
jgi:hypothetical protein